MASTPDSPLPQNLVGAVSTALISSLADAKAYEVPSLCERYRLAPGTEDEAFKSKAAYVSRRLQAVPAQGVIAIAREHAAENVNFALSEALARLDERDEPQITELTRKRIIQFLKEAPLLSEGDELQFFERLWPIDQVRCVIDIDGWRSFKEAFIRHTFANDDWDREDVLRALAPGFHRVGVAGPAAQRLSGAGRSPPRAGLGR